MKTGGRQYSGQAEHKYKLLDKKPFGKRPDKRQTISCADDKESLN
jgi:hypothetical protein